VTSLERSVLLAPDVVARALAGRAPDARQRWMLRQPREVRASFAREALDLGDRAEEIWMLRQPDAVRESYIREVLEAT
jgi:hypothetical protein